MKKFVFLILITFIIKTHSFAQEGWFWQQTNGPYSSDQIQIWCLAVRDDGLMFAGENSKGLFKSTDNGNYWSPANSGIGSASTFSIAFDSQGVIYIGTYDGVFRSTDDGQNWSNLMSVPNVISLELNSLGYIFAGAAGTGIYRSTDNGASWSAVNNGIPSGGQVITAIFANHNGDMFAGTNDGIYRSTNNGNYWIHYPDIIETIQDIKITGLGYLIAGSAFSGNVGNFYMSTDNGSSWMLKWNNNLGVKCLQVDPITDDIYAGTIFDGVYVSTNSGDDWSKVSGAVPNNNVIALVLNPDGDIFDGTWNDGVFRSTDKGESWDQKNTGFAYPQTFNMAVNSGDFIFVGTDEGVFRSEDSGNNWVAAGNGLIDDYIYSLAIDPNDNIFVGVSVYGVSRSTNDGESWYTLGPQLQNVLAIAFSPNNYIFVGTYDGGVFRAINGSPYWTPVNSGLTSSYIRCLAVNQNQEIFAGTQVGVFRSRDYGASWTAVNNGLTFLNIRCLSFNLQQDIFAGTTGGGIYRSDDSGENWKEINNGLPANLIKTIVCDSIGEIFAGTTSGVFRSTDNGDNWVEVNEGLGDVNVYGLSLNSEQYIFAASLGRGVWKSVNPVVTKVEKEKVSFDPVELSQNYPNPFNPTTKIKYQFPEMSKVKLTVYDVLGREVKTLVNEEKPAGNYEVEFDGTNLTSGIYFYRIETEKFSDTKKFVLLK